MEDVGGLSAEESARFAEGGCATQRKATSDT